MGVTLCLGHLKAQVNEGGCLGHLPMYASAGAQGHGGGVDDQVSDRTEKVVLIGVPVAVIGLAILLCWECLED